MKPAFQSRVCESKGTFGDQATGEAAHPVLVAEECGSAGQGARGARGQWVHSGQSCPRCSPDTLPTKTVLPPTLLPVTTSGWRKFARAPPSSLAQEFDEALPQPESACSAPSHQT